MIAKKIHRDSAGRTAATQIAALVNYIFAGDLDDPTDKLVASGFMNLYSDSAKAAVAEMTALSMSAPKSKMPVSHWVISWKQGEAPTVDQARQAVETFVRETGFRGHQIVWGMHGNTSNRHVHVAINRIHPESERVVKPNRGFDRLAAQRAIAYVEHAQGWSHERNSKYMVDDFGRIHERKASAATNTEADGERFLPDYRARGAELRQGVKSHQRIANEELAAVIRDAKTWAELHTSFAYHCATYELYGGGAVIKMNGATIKASTIGASPKKLSRRLGPFQPCDPSISAVVAAAPTIPLQPIDAEGAAYHEERAVVNDARRRARAKLDTRIDAMREALKVQQRAERDSALQGSWEGKGNERNAIEAVIAEKHKRERDELQASIKREREALRE